MNPSIGRTVHYVQYPSGRHLPAVVTDVLTKDRVDHHEVELCVLTAQGTFGVASSTSDEETKAPGTWHEPERV